MLVVVSVAGGVSSLSCTHNKISAFMSRGQSWGGVGKAWPVSTWGVFQRREGHPKGKKIEQTSLI